MINFIKQLFGFGAPQETVKEILTPPAKAVAPAATYIPPAKPVNKVRAVSDSGTKVVTEAVAPKPANKKRRPYRGNNSVKPAQVAKAKPAAPKPAKKK